MMIDYDLFSDNEINYRVHVAHYDEPKDHAKILVRDYCRDWRAAGELIEGYRISLNCDSITINGCIWQAGGDFKLQHRDKNPLRAAMICFLKMKDAEK